MSLISNLARNLLYKLGWLAIFAGCAIIGGESYAGLSFTPATARVVDIFQKCELVDTSGRGIKYIGNGMCNEMASLQASLLPRQLEVRPFRAVNVSFVKMDGQEVISAAHLAGLGVSNPKPGDTVAILYNPSNPATVRGPANIPSFAYFSLIAGVLMHFARHQLSHSGQNGPRGRPAGMIQASPVPTPARSAPGGGFGRRMG